MSKSQELYKQLCEHVRKTSLVTATQALLEWDQQTKLPEQAGKFRSEQITHFAGEIHRRQTDPRLGELLAELAESELASDPHSDTGCAVKELKREFDKQVKLPAKLVEQIAATTSLGQQEWVAARKANDFSAFAPTLREIFRLKREEAEAIGYDDCPYDALLDTYEPYAKTKEVAQVLEALRQELVPLVAAIAESKAEIPVDVLRRSYPVNAQEKFAKEASAKIGFDYRRGRLDTTHHPFCTELGPNDCRITTRFDKSFFSPAFFGTLHEAGHGMYEQGLRPELYGLPPGKYCSLGIHESQSRLWENLVGRRLSFWQHFYPSAQEHFPLSLQNVALADFYQAINHVQPSLIRVEADEATYNLHIIIRFQLEQEVINGDLATDDLPEAWNQHYSQSLGIKPATDANGVLQDIHWSAGLIGYFSTYSLGNLYASQLFRAAEAELGDMDILFRMGDFQPLQNWLDKNVYKQGMRYPPRQLVKNATGKELSHVDLIAQLTEKLAPIYGL